MSTTKAQLDNRRQAGLAIRKTREDSGISLRQLAKRIGISASYLHQIETGTVERPPAYAALKSIGESLGLDVVDLCLMSRRLPDPVRDEILDDPVLFETLYRKARL
jgi:transcriptional regulator with XRE-family HTH domain